MNSASKVRQRSERPTPFGRVGAGGGPPKSRSRDPSPPRIGCHGGPVKRSAVHVCCGRFHARRRRINANGIGAPRRCSGFALL
eukprot:2591927-Prymnesium_polylepis.1